MKRASRPEGAVMLDRLFKSPKEKVLSVLKSKFAMMYKIVLCVKMYIDFFSLFV